MKKLLILFPLLVTIALGQPASVTPTNQTLMVNGTTGAIAAPVSSATFISANGLITASTVNGYFADPSTNGSFSASAWRTDLSVLTAAEIAAAYQPLDSDLTAIAALTTTSYGRSFLDRADAAAARTLMGVVIGTDVQAYDVDLSAFGNLATTGLVARTGSGTAATRTLTAPAAGITVTNGDGVSGNPTLALANDLAGLEGLAANGLATRTATDTWTNRTIAGTSPISVSNGDGVAGNPTISIGAATTSATGVVELATTAESLAGTDSARAPSVASQEARLLIGDHTRHHRDILYHDGATTSARTYAPLSTFGDGLGSAGSAFSVLKRVKMPTAAATRGIWQIASSNGGIAFTGNGMLCYLHSTDKIRVDLSDNSAANRRYIGTDSSVITRFGGQWIALAIVYDGTSTKPTLYINGVAEATTEATAGTAPAWNAGFADDFYDEGLLIMSSLYSGAMEPGRVINATLSAAEVLEWTQTGRLPPWCEMGTGSLVANYTSDFSAGTNSWSAVRATGAGNIDAIGGLDDNYRLTVNSDSSTTHYTERTSQTVVGRRYRITGKAFKPSGNATINSIALYGATSLGASPAQYGATGALTNDTWTDFTFDFTAYGTSLVFYMGIGSSFSSVTGNGSDVLYLRELTVRSLGPLARWEIQPVDSSLGGVIARDAGANNIPLIGVPGVTPITTSNRGVISATLTWSGTHEAKSIIGQAALPSNARVEYITSKATAASTGSGMTVGSVTTPALFVTANTYTTAKEDHTLAARLPAGTASNDLNLVVDPDDANYTGSITVTVGYTTTISTP